jgi:hypothetical protein
MRSVKSSGRVDAVKKNSRTGIAITTSGNRDNIKEAFLKRSYQALQRLTENVPSEELVEALAAPTDIGGIARLLSDIGALQPEYTALDPWAEFLAKGVIVKQELLRQAGGAYTTGQVAEMLGISRQAVQQRARRGTLLALTGGTTERYYPAIQFGENGTVEGLEEVLAAFTITDPWTRLSVLLDTDDLLGGKRVIDALRVGRQEEVLRVVRSFGG